MQKKIVALAIAAAFSAPAFADTTVYGIVDAAIANVSATGLKSNMQVISGGLSTSRIGVVAAEDLNNGMKAIAKVEYKLDGAVSDGVLAARQEMVALAGGFGTVAAGYLQTTGYDWAVKFDPAAGSAVSTLQNVNAGFLVGSTAAAARANRALAYISPDLGGVTVAVNYSTNFADTAMVATGATTGNKTTATMLSATYAAGPLAVGGVYAATANDNANYNKTTDMALGASYDLTVAKLLGTYQTNKTDNGAGTNKAMSFSAVVPVGPGAIVASYATSTTKVGAVAAVAATPFTINTATGAITGNVATAAAAAYDSKLNSVALVYLQGLSKTTTAYAALNKTTHDVGTGTNADTTVIAVGLKKVF